MIKVIIINNTITGHGIKRVIPKSGFSGKKITNNVPTIIPTIIPINVPNNAMVKVSPDIDLITPFLDKPIDKQQLLQMIPDVIKKAQKRKRRPKWEKEREKDWAKKASQSQ